ncbi:MAG: hypothetical protein KKF46_05030 [Nanoarchaeota archaeon]|nr:hypothetical protein [Nanoarchaeota archaeon]MBU1321697.1 hypothetical protein [Nanoarchaeota archaeon]MBU1597277.1 hypothetical protein [Nanoarchaeota archaeon]MBU2442241.1 hypothetical protein [Nanoarchaeota archaeon]
MGRKTVALSVDEDIYASYKKFCENNSMILSRKIDQFMKDELQKEDKNVR